MKEACDKQSEKAQPKPSRSSQGQEKANLQTDQRPVKSEKSEKTRKEKKKI